MVKKKERKVEVRRVKESKVLQILNIKAQGLTQADAVRILGYGKSTVQAIYNGKYRMIPFINPKKWVPIERKVWISGMWAGKRWTSEGWAVLINKQGPDFPPDPDPDPDADSEYETPNYVGSRNAENNCIDKEEAMFLHSILDTLTDRDRKIIQAKADGQSDRATKAEFKTSVEHIRAVRIALMKKLGERGRSMLIKTYTGRDVLPRQEAWFEHIPNRSQQNKPRSEKWWRKGPWWKDVVSCNDRIKKKT